MDYRVDIEFKPKYELINSLHAYICRKSHKKLVLAPGWMKETGKRLTSEFASQLDQMQVDSDWKFMHLLIYLCKDEVRAEDFLAWLEAKSTGDLYELMADYSRQFPEDMAEFREKALNIFSKWNEQYFMHADIPILQSLQAEADVRKEEMARASVETFVDRTTNGLAFHSKEGLEQLVLVPQYHFQPMNVIYNYGKLTLCHYSARIYDDHPSSFPLHEYHMIRALAEQSRLKILQYLHEGTRSFTEIVRYMKLSKGITHDHISKLRIGGFIRAHVDGETITGYSLRPEMLDYLHGKLKEFVFASME